MEFEWDEDKNKACIAQRGINFADIVSVFLDPFRETIEDIRENYGEQRFQVTGHVGHRLVVVIYTMRGAVIRIISARKANAREVNRYGNSTH